MDERAEQRLRGLLDAASNVPHSAIDVASVKNRAARQRRAIVLRGVAAFTIASAGGTAIPLAFAGGSAHPALLVTSPPPRPTAEGTAALVRVSPTRHLHDGERIHVTIRAFPGGSKVYISQCADRRDASKLGCGAELASQEVIYTHRHGSGSGNFTVHRMAFAGGPSSEAVRCWDQCVLVATAGAVSNPVVAAASLHFAP